MSLVVSLGWKSVTMPDGWKPRALRELATIFDGPHATPRKTESGPWYVSISSLIDGRLELDKSAHISLEDLPRWTKRVRPLPGDTLFSYETRLGDAAHWQLDIPAAIGRRMGILRPKEGVDARFLTYAYLGPEFQEQIRRRTIRGATVDRLPISEMGEWTMEVPEFEEQRRIAEVLGAVDDLIDTNERLCDAILELGQAEFRAVAGDGSRTKSIRELAASAARGTTPKYSDAADSVLVLNQKCVRDCRVDLAKARLMTPKAVPPHRVAQPGDTVVNSTGVGTLGRAARWFGGKSLYLDSHLTVVKPAPGVPSALLAYAVLNLVPSIEALAEGSTGQTELSAQRLLSLETPWPDESKRKELSSFLDTLDQGRESLDEEIVQMRRTRDELLPLLMSGKVRARDLEVAAA